MPRFLVRNLFSSSCSVVERELNVPLPISKIIKKWNNLLQEYKVSKRDAVAAIRLNPPRRWLNCSLHRRRSRVPLLRRFTQCSGLGRINLQLIQALNDSRCRLAGKSCFFVYCPELRVNPRLSIFCRNPVTERYRVESPRKHNTKPNIDSKRRSFCSSEFQKKNI